MNNNNTLLTIAVVSMIIVFSVGFIIVSSEIKTIKQDVMSTLQLLKTNGESDVTTLKNVYENTSILKAVSEDYLPKKSLGDREWCLNFSCLLTK